jgi:hypothetical protein
LVTSRLAEGFNPERLNVIDFNLGIGEKEMNTILPMVLGGFFIRVLWLRSNTRQRDKASLKKRKTIRQLLLAKWIIKISSRINILYEATVVTDW